MEKREVSRAVDGLKQGEGSRDDFADLDGFLTLAPSDEQFTKVFEVLQKYQALIRSIFKK